MKKTPSIIDTYYKSLGTKIFRDTTALPFADGGPLNDRNIHGDLLPSVYASALGRYYGNGGQMKPDYSLPEDSFQQGGNGLKNSVYASSMGQYPAPYAMGGAMNQYPDGGSIYTYAKRPGSYYQKDSDGNWLISNKGTGGQYVPIDDPSGQRAVALNKGAVVSMANPTASKYDNVTPSYGKSPMVQSVAGRTGVNPNADVFGSPSQNLNQGLSAIGINSMANVPNQDGLLENAVEFMDPSGVSSWDDASSAKDEWSASGNTVPTLNQAMDMFGAVPGLGKLGKLKYLSSAPDALKTAYKYIPWQQILNGIDTVEDIDSDNSDPNIKNLPVETEQSNRKYPNGGGLETASDLVPTTLIPEGPVIPGEQETRDFYTNWYSKRTLPFDEIGNKQYEKTMKSILPAYNPESTLLNEINEGKLPYEVTSNLGDPYATGAIVYDKKGNPEKIQLSENIMNDPAALRATMTHEERTRIMDPYVDQVYPAERRIIEPSIKTFEEGWGKLSKEDQDRAGATYDYLTNPQEDNIQSMLFEVRRSKNLQPDQTITDEDIQNWKLEAEQNGALDRNNPNYDPALYNLFKLSKDNSSMKNLFNYIASDNTPKANNMNMFPTYGGNFT